MGKNGRPKNYQLIKKEGKTAYQSMTDIQRRVMKYLTPLDVDKYYTPKEIADLSNVSEATVYEYMHMPVFQEALEDSTRHYDVFLRLNLKKQLYKKLMDGTATSIQMELIARITNIYESDEKDINVNFGLANVIEPPLRLPEKVIQGIVINEEI